VSTASSSPSTTAVTVPLVEAPSLTPPIATTALPVAPRPIASVPRTVKPPNPVKAPVAAPPPPPGATVFANCAALNAVYPHGVGRTGAVDHVSGSSKPVTDFLVDDALYNANPGRDGDGDGVACEKH
jgi:hypothetical protein